MRITNNNKSKQNKPKQKPKSNKFKVQNDNLLARVNKLSAALGNLTKDIKYFKTQGTFPGVSQDYVQVSKALVQRKELYLRQLLDPRGAVESGRVVGLPAELPIPTTLVAYHSQNTFTNKDGNDYLSSLQFFWLPAFFSTKPNLDQAIDSWWKQDPEFPEDAPTNRYHCNLYRLLANGERIFAYASKTSTIDFQKYRLVSASIHLKYTSNVLTQSGIAYASMNYTEDLPNISIASENELDHWLVTNGNAYNLVGPTGVSASMTAAKFVTKDNILNSNFSVSNQIQVGKDTVSAIYLPSDPISKSFKKPGTVGVSEIKHVQSQPAVTPRYVVAGTGSPSLGAQPIYSFLIDGLPTTASVSFAVDTYYIWEVIPPAAEAALFKTAKATDIPMTPTELNSVIADVMKQPIKAGTWDWVKTTIKQYGPKLLKKGAEYLVGALI